MMRSASPRNPSRHRASQMYWITVLDASGGERRRRAVVGMERLWTCQRAYARRDWGGADGGVLALWVYAVTQSFARLSSVEGGGGFGRWRGSR